MAIITIPALRVQVDTDIDTNGVGGITGTILNSSLINTIDSLEAIIGFSAFNENRTLPAANNVVEADMTPDFSSVNRAVLTMSTSTTRTINDASPALATLASTFRIEIINNSATPTDVVFNAKYKDSSANALGTINLAANESIVKYFKVQNVSIVVSFIEIGSVAGSGTTNLSIANKTATTLDVASDTGADATLPQVTITEAGVMSAADKIKLNSDIPSSEKGANNGVATLDGGGKVPADQLPTSLLDFKGNWDASTNTPTLANTDTDVQGHTYRVNVAGTVDFGAGNIIFDIGDWVYNNGTIWDKGDNTDAVASVFGRTGVVAAQSGDYTAAQVTGALVITDIIDPISVQLTDGFVGTTYIGADEVYSGTINEIRLETDSGTLDFTVQIGGVTVTGLSSITATSTKATTVATALNTFVDGDTISIITASDSSAVKPRITIKITRS